MNRRLVLVILAALVIVLIVAVGISVAANSNAEFNNTKLSPYTTGHANARKVSETKCQVCHEPAAGGGYNAHATHQKTLFLAYKDVGTGTAEYNGCGLCHGQFTAVGSGVKVGYEGDLSYADTTYTTDYSGKVRKQVSAEVCRRCHGGFTSSAVGHSGVNINSDCLSCHKTGGVAGTVAAAHDKANLGNGVTWINRSVIDNTSVPQFCTLCHGQTGSTSPDISNRVWYQMQETNPTSSVGL